jgi:hypothetical protein
MLQISGVSLQEFLSSLLELLVCIVEPRDWRWNVSVCLRQLLAGLAQEPPAPLSATKGRLRRRRRQWRDRSAVGGYVACEAQLGIVWPARRWFRHDLLPKALQLCFYVGVLRRVLEDVFSETFRDRVFTDIICRDLPDRLFCSNLHDLIRQVFHRLLLGYYDLLPKHQPFGLSSSNLCGELDDFGGHCCGGLRCGLFLHAHLLAMLQSCL